MQALLYEKSKLRKISKSTYYYSYTAYVDPTWKFSQIKQQMSSCRY